jgi:hypothetical protein
MSSLISIDRAEAVIGRPLTPGSVAGIHRRATRRAYRRDYYYGTGAGTVGTGVVAGGVPGATYAPYAGSQTYAAGVSNTGSATSSASQAAAPSFVHDAIVVPPGLSATVTDPATGRQCTISTSGYRWCWTP